jgi:glycosyltransferase involved in cell wall biosynthesis
MNGKARVSVIIPSYNCARYVGQSVESVFAQSRQPEEIIVVDDGSTDGTRQALELYRGRIRYIYQENRGAAAARNNGIRTATGDFVAFLDADDLWLPEKLEFQMEYFARHPNYGLVYSDMKIFDESGIIHESVKQWLGMSMPVGYVFRQLFWDTLFIPAAVVCRKACFERAGLFDERLVFCEDYEMWLRIARLFEFGCVDKPLVMYRKHSNQSTQTLGRTLVNGVPREAQALLKILDLYPETVQELGRTTVRRRLARPYFFLAYDAVASGDHRQARRLLRQALRRWPTNLRYQLFYLATFLTPSQFAKTRALYHRLSGTSEGQERGQAYTAPTAGAAQGRQT